MRNRGTGIDDSTSCICLSKPYPISHVKESKACTEVHARSSCCGEEQRPHRSGCRLPSQGYANFLSISDAADYPSEKV